MLNKLKIYSNTFQIEESKFEIMKYLLLYTYYVLGPLKGSEKNNCGVSTKRGGMDSESTNMVVDMDLSDEDLDDIFRGLILFLYFFIFVFITFISFNDRRSVSYFCYNF